MAARKLGQAFAICIGLAITTVAYGRPRLARDFVPHINIFGQWNRRSVQLSICSSRPIFHKVDETIRGHEERPCAAYVKRDWPTLNLCEHCSQRLGSKKKDMPLSGYAAFTYHLIEAPRSV